MRAVSDGLACGIVYVEIRVGPVRAVERFREDSRRRRFSCAAWADEEVGVRDPLARNRIFQGPHNMILAYDVIERLRPPFARDYLVGRGQAGVMKLKVEKRKLKDGQRERQSGTPKV
jgi:hypothetical protein